MRQSVTTMGFGEGMQRSSGKRDVSKWCLFGETRITETPTSSDSSGFLTTVRYLNNGAAGYMGFGE